MQLSDRCGHGSGKTRQFILVTTHKFESHARNGMYDAWCVFSDSDSCFRDSNYFSRYIFKRRQHVALGNAESP